MADEMPVCDVLCEAMEYLTKLGSNLRSRSESLKEKKIKKEKLKNAHAVQKAASKVLLICELSKKSLENVENGVKKVLELVDAAQKSTGRNGGNTSNTSKRPPKYIKEVVINGKKYKLKIPQNISLKHYNSVSVIARSMPNRMVKNYPVYFDCKLFRLRQKRHSKACNESGSDENMKLGSSEESRKERKSDPASSDDNCVQTNKNEEKCIKGKNNDCDRKNEEDSKHENEDKINIDNHSKNNSKSSESSDISEKSKRTEVASQEIQCSKNLQPDKKHRSDSYFKEKQSKKYKKLKIVEDSSDSETEKCNKSSKNEKFKESCHQIDNKKTEASVIDLDSDDDVNPKKPSAETEHEVEVESESDKQKEIVNDEIVNNEVEGDDSQPSKPLIKCVNISKLLKPDVVLEENIKSVSIAKMARGLYHKISQKETTTKKLNVYEARKAIMRKVVAEFKPKKFVIDLPRLPKFSNEFLQQHHLKRVTQNGKIVFELKNNENSESEIELGKKKQAPGSSNSSGFKQSEESKNSSNEEILDKAASAYEAKNVLLNDSDNEKSKNSPPKQLNIENVKNSLLHHSSDEKEDGEVSANVVTTEKCVPDISNGSVHNSTQNEDNSIEKYTNELQSEIQKLSKNNTEQLAGEDQDKELAKSSLLNDSSDGTPSKKSNENKKDTTPSRRKHIMESMHAKKMLLTYSSSSDTEDEQLKDVMKNIKEDLLKTVGSEDEAKKRVKKKLLSSSDSDDSSKKKRKIVKSVAAESKSGDEKAGDDSEKQKSDSDQADTSDVSKSRHKKMGRSKPSGSSSPKLDGQNDKEIEGLTNLNSLNQKSRRRGSESEEAAKISTNKVLKVKISPLVTGEGLLEAPNSSDGASDAESGAEDELPTVSLTGLNGGGVDHLAKDDLLEESESDSSKDKSSQDVKKEDDSDADNVKAKRRKGNTISSDSEAGSSRKKEAAREKMSDFEDSETESSEPKVKRSKRKKIVDSEASEGSSNEDGKKKRRRIKQLDDSEGSGSDTENEGKSKHGRKNIRKVMGKNQLEEATKKAAREEKERVARIAERQKLYNNLEFDESGKPDEVVLDKVVLDFDPETKEPLIEVDRGLVKKLKPHQANGIKFMWDACFESVKRIKKDKGSGCILAHCMGLGKTLQVVSLTHTLLIHSDLTKVNRVLVVCPLSTVLNWVNEFRMWLKHAETDYEVDVYELSRHKQNSERAFQLSQWFQHGGVCVLGYEMFRNLSADNVKKFKKKMLKQFQESLVDPGPDLVVCDEGHLLKNEKTSLSQSMNRVKTLRRIVLTGTPLQNNLKEYYCMVQFVKPNLLGKYNEYLNRFVNPITNGQYTDSTEHDIRVMKRRSHVLHKMLDGAVQRRDYGVLAPFLPPKHEYVLFITLTEVQIKLYQHYLDNYSRRPLAGKSSGFLFPDFQSLQRIWTHPLVLKYNSERYEIMQQKKREREEEDSEGSLVDFIDDDSTPDETSTEESSDDLSDASDDSRKKSKKKKSSKKGKTKDSKVSTRRTTRANPVELEEMLPDPDILEVRNENPTEWWIKLVEEDELEDMRNSHKLVLLFEILRQCEAIGDKLLVFSQSLYSLDLIEHFLGKVDEATQEGRVDEKLGGHVGSWSPGVDYFRLDGSTSCENRSIWCKNFNREDNPRARLFLISTRAGGLGINLVAANRVVIFDVSWNPSHDVQSIFRVYRFGQKKPCYIYRFLAMGTMEEKIYERQVTKQAISKRVIDEQQIDRHYAENDLAELYKFEPRPPAPRPVPLVPKDRFFAEMLKEHEAVIYKFHEHDSLLENKEEETLSEEERKAAWEDFENEKNRPPPAPFPSWPMHNGMVPNLLAQQQQQLAYAALAQMLRKDMPNLSDENIRNMLPIIYSTNPGMFGGYDYGLMQKMTDIYKYAQPGMMNPAMMNPMNTGGGTGSMGGGTSGLQYEPPWQRQQQQQQQMRLQQMLQQQNSMGAKLYAGGLGSRDPVAMALQQQRAREIMLGNHAASSSASSSAGRPRGRPPLAPRLPATAPADVVNLDSD